MDDKTGEFRYESRSTDETVSLEMLNCTEKERFMNAEKNVAIISEAASSGISLQVGWCHSSFFNSLKSY
jgi:hypothetical protein